MIISGLKPNAPGQLLCGGLKLVVTYALYYDRTVNLRARMISGVM